MGLRQDQATPRTRRPTARETGLRRKHRVTVVSVKPENQAWFTHANADSVLTYGSEIVIAGRPLDVERFVDLQ